MGAYRSKPITDKASSDDSGKYVKCGASSMQGWRVTQEDAHNCIIEYDENTSFFAVYDGHGSHEVAEYCSRKLPDYLKNCGTYKSQEYSKALKDAFLGFDATLIEPEVVKVLKQIAKDEGEDAEENQNSESDDEENIRSLYEEAQMPLEEVMAKYQADAGSPQTKKGLGATPPSPYVIANQASRSKAPSDPSEAGSSKAGCSSKCSEVTESSSTEVVNSSGDGGKASTGEEETSACNSKERNGEKVPQDNEVSECEAKKTESTSEAESKTGNETLKGQEEGTTSKTEETIEVAERNESKEHTNIEDNVPTKENEVPELEKEESKATCEEKLEVNGKEDKEKQEPHENGEVGSEDTEEEEAHEDKIMKSMKGKGKAILKKLEFSKRQSARQRSVAILFRSLLAAQGAESESDDDEGDESFEGADDSSNEDDNDEADGSTEEVEDSEEGEEEEEEEEEEGGEEEEEEEDDDDVNADDELKGPGVESGCTAVVALLHGRDLYVANAGDSRCIVSRDGEALDMSLDHKPEDAVEIQRIVAAGGYVSRDGRVKGGLNLSRAIGDHTYKRTDNLPPEEQMITALPDVRTLSLDPKQDEFMILACDGIWNSMSSQEVVNFVRTRLQDEEKKLSTICEELFDFCLAPNTFRDESGCDNMTAVIVQFLPLLSEASSCDLPNTALPNTCNKRPASPTEDVEKEAKRIKTEGEAE